MPRIKLDADKLVGYTRTDLTETGMAKLGTAKLGCKGGDMNETVTSETRTTEGLSVTTDEQA